MSGEIQAEYAERVKGGEEDMEIDVDQLMELVKEIVPFNMQHNAECEACDLLMEVERLHTLEEYVDEQVYERVCLYLVRLVVSVNTQWNLYNPVLSRSDLISVHTDNLLSFECSL